MVSAVVVDHNDDVPQVTSVVLHKASEERQDMIRVCLVYKLEASLKWVSTNGTYSGAGSTGDDEDISTFTGTFGAQTSGTATVTLDLSSLGISTGEDVDGVSVIE